MGEVINRVWKQYNHALKRHEVIVSFREEEPDFAAILNDWSTVMSDLGVSTVRCIGKHAPELIEKR